ncbi:archaemetzincin-1-like [Sycon ciliatum]|uniref:archaemetzincin-1-like n=1 Tax=Sycon ciliatum TaxID=27933 RepID=UPI0031F69C08
MSKTSRKRKAGEAVASVPFAPGFKPPGAAKVKRALGRLTKPDSAYEDDGETPFFQSIPKPTSEDDWLAQYNETGQTYDQFLEQSPWLASRRLTNMKQTFNKSGQNLAEKYPDGKIYLLPLGSFGDEIPSEQFDKLVEYTQAFFGSVPVVQLPGVALDVDKSAVYWNGEVRTEPEHESDNRHGEPAEAAAAPPPAKRCKPSGRAAKGHRHPLSARFHKTQEGTTRVQLRVDGVLDRLRRSIPDDALCLVALTMMDLFHSKPDLFVAGYAGFLHRVGVFSFHRYQPGLKFSSEFWHELWQEEDSSTACECRSQEVLLQRSCRLLVHEICHLFCIDHCIFHACCMNGSGHLQEDFSQPMYLCPVDLRKLQVLCGFNIVDRYKKLAEFFQRNNLTNESQWYKRRIEFIETAGKE